MNDKRQSGHAATKPVRIQVALREQGILEGQIILAAGQSLTKFVSSRNGALVVSNALFRETGRELDQVTARANEILWVRALGQDVELANIPPLQSDIRTVEITIAGGSVMRGRVAMFKGQKVTDMLSTAGQFLPLMRARSVDDGKPMGDVVVNREAIQTVREVGTGDVAGDIAPANSSATPRVHWLVTLARQVELPGAQGILFPPTTPIEQVWSTVCTVAAIDQDELARRVAAHLRLPLADLASTQGSAQDDGSLFERFGVRVLSDDGRTLTVATADPLNADAEQALAFGAKRRIAFAVAAPRALGIATEVTGERDVELESLLAGVANTSNTIRFEDDDLEPQEVDLEDISAEPVIKLANLILREGVRQNASDIHLEPDQSRGIVRFRVDGVLRPFMHIPLVALNRVISRFKINARLDIADRVRPQDGRIRLRVDGKRYEIRVSTVPTQDAEKAVLRIAGSAAEQTLDQLEIPEHELAVLRKLLAHRDGIVIVTGPTGSGKTTTLYGALSELNDGTINIMTVEDPIERALQGTTQIQVQPKRGVTFASALRAILRQDPDVILLGEIRDLETAEIAVQAAMTGHLVLTTLHTTSAVGVVSRLADLGLDRATLASALRGVVAQRLARKVCAQCQGSGCEKCEGIGFRGRIPLLEVLPASPHFTELVGSGAGYHELQRAAVAAGMRPIRQVAEERVRAGETTDTEVVRVIGTPEDEARMEAARFEAARIAAARDGALPAGGNGSTTGLMRLPAGPAAEGASGLPARYNGWDQQPDLDTPARRRALSSRALLQGLDRCIAEGQSVNEAMHFASQQLAAAFDSPLVWIGTVEDGALSIRARAGACAPYVHDIVAQLDHVESGDGAIATALRTGDPQARHIDQEPGFDSWRDYARAYGLPIFLVVPMEGRNGPLGVVGVHAQSAEGLDQQAGNELVSLVDRITGALERLRHLEAVRLQLSALESAADSVFTTDRRGIIQWVNRAFVQLTGYSAAEAMGQTPQMLRSDKHDPAFYREIWDTVAAGQSWRGEIYNKRKNGDLVVVEQTITPVTNDRGEVSYFLSVQRDISERKEREEAVRALVNHDVVTGLPNGRALDIELNRAITSAADQGSEGSLLLIHLSGSSALRDVAPEAADKLIGIAAQILKLTLRPGDYMARLGDDEFAALLSDTPANSAVIAADRLRSAFSSHAFDIPELTATPSVSIGIAPIDGSQGSRAVLAMADTALYGSGGAKDSIVVSQCNDDQDIDTAAENVWGQRIKDALRDDQFFLHFQPVVRLSNRTVSHFDAMIRLHDDDGDVIPARAFISHAERLGLIPQMDRWVVENVLRLLPVTPDLRISVNISAATVMSAAFRNSLQKHQRNLNAVGSRIIFEVGEVGAVENLARVRDGMNKLAALGCRFALDNFGIGGNSLASLGALPVDYVKLDGSLIRGIDRDESARELVQALVTVARALGKEAIAGWAERESIVALLPKLGIGLAQGHHLGRPSRELRTVDAGDEPVQELDLAIQAQAFNAKKAIPARIAV